MLDTLHERLAECHGLAIAAATVTTKVEHLVPRGSLHSHLRAMRDDADETRARCRQVERACGAVLADALRAHATGIDQKVADLVNAWFKAGTGPLAAWTFLTMSEAGEVAAWRVVAALAARAGLEATPVRALAAWALPVHERHLRVALKDASLLGGTIEPRAPRWG
jgi:hypothetical protein